MAKKYKTNKNKQTNHNSKNSSQVTSSNKKASLRYRNRNKELGTFFLLPILFIVGIVPLIFKGKYIELEGIESIFWVDSFHLDIFTYYKVVFYIAATVILCLMFAYLTSSRKLEIKKVNYNIFFAVYAGLILLSTLFSDEIGLSFRGYVDTYQGAIVLFCYLFTAFAVFNMITSEKQIKIVFKVLIFSSLVFAIIGIPQYFGFDAFQTKQLINIYRPANILLTPEDMAYLYEGRIYGTFMHSNYIGNYSVLIIPLIIPMFFYENNKKLKAVYALALVAGFIVWLGSESRAGYVGLFATILVLIVFFRKMLFKYKKFVISALIILVIMGTGLNYAMDGRIFEEFASLNIFSQTTNTDKIRFEDISLNESICTIITNKCTLKIDVTNGAFLVFDENDNKLDTNVKDDVLTFNDDKYKGFKVVKYDREGYRDFFIYYNNSYLMILKQQKDRIYAESSERRILESIQPVEKIGFENNEEFASARGYIWSRTLPLLKNTVFLGYGPDNFIVNFPQHDLAGKLNGYRTTKMLVTKTHNMYLQIAVNTGILSLVVYLIMIAIYLIDCIKLYFMKKEYNFYSVVGICICASVIGYLASGMFNDSLIYSAPIYWTLLGVGMSVNYATKSQKVER